SVARAAVTPARVFRRFMRWTLPRRGRGVKHLSRIEMSCPPAEYGCDRGRIRARISPATGLFDHLFHCLDDDVKPLEIRMSHRARAFLAATAVTVTLAACSSGGAGDGGGSLVG